MAGVEGEERVENGGLAIAEVCGFWHYGSEEGGMGMRTGTGI